MDYSEFYQFGSALTQGALLVRSNDVEDKLPFIFGEAEAIAPLRFTHHLGRRVYDVVETDWARLFLFSERVTTALQAHQISGWKSYPAEVYNQRGARVPGYSVFAVTGRSGPVNRKKGKLIVRAPLRPTGPPRRWWVGVYFDLASWDSSDVFVPEGSLRMIGTQKVIDLFEKLQVSNLRWQAVTEVRRRVWKSYFRA